MMPLINYYMMLGVPPNAPAENIQDAYRREEQIWRKRAVTSSDANVKNEALRRLALLKEALDTLSNGQRRFTYDGQLAASQNEPSISPAPDEVSPHNLIEQAEAYLAEANYLAAVRVAREATIKLSDSAESWFVLSRAKAGLRELNDAVYEAKKAIELDPANSKYYYNLGMIFEQFGLWKEALGMYEQATQRDPSESRYQLAISRVYIQTNQPAEALSIIKRVYSMLPDDETVCSYYAQALIMQAKGVPSDKSAEGFAITNAEEILQMRNCLNRTSSIKHLGQETKKTIRDIEAYLHYMETYTFHIPLGARSAAMRFIGTMGTGEGCYDTLLMVALTVVMFGGFALLPLLVLIWSFSLLTSGSIMGGLFLLLCSVGLGYVWYRNIWVPRWKVNARKYSQGAETISFFSRNPMLPELPSNIISKIERVGSRSPGPSKLPGDIVSKMERFGQYEFNPQTNAYNAEDVGRLMGELYPFASADPDGFLVSLADAVLPVGGWAAYGASRTIWELLSPSDESICKHPSYGPIMLSAINFLRANGVPPKHVRNYEWDFWLDAGGTMDTWIQRRPIPTLQEAPITELRPGETRKVTQQSSAPDSNTILARQNSDGQYCALVDAKWSDENPHRDQSEWKFAVSMYELYIEIGLALQAPPYWCDNQLEPYFPLPRPKI